MSASENENKMSALKILVGNASPSTEYLLDVSLDPREYTLDFVHAHDTFLRALTNSTHDIYMIDESESPEENKLKTVQKIAALKLKNKVRVLLLLDTAPPPDTNRMQSFGPFCALEVFFTRERLANTLDELMDIKDTGSRVKTDDKFFDINIFKQ